MIRHSDRLKIFASNQALPEPFQGTWRDEHGSVMTLIQKGNAVRGHYETAFNEKGPLEEFELSGFFNQDLICFSVDFGRRSSLASWVGQLSLDEFDEEVLRTAWLLSRNLVDPENPTSIRGVALSGTNEFRRISN